MKLIFSAFVLSNLSLVWSQQPESVCTSAVPLPPGDSVGSTTLDGTLSTRCGSDGSSTYNSWFSFSSTDRWTSLYLCPNNDIPGALWDLSHQFDCESSDEECLLIRDDPPVNPDDFQTCFTSGMVKRTINPWNTANPPSFVASVSSGPSPDTQGSFVLHHIIHEPPANNLCLGAIPLTVNADPTASDFYGAITSDELCQELPVTAVFFSFVGTGGDVIVRACPDSDPTYSLEIKVQTSCDATECICNPGQSCGGSPIFEDTCDKGYEHIIEGTVSGQTYYAYVSKDFASTSHTFKVSVSDYPEPTSAPTETPATTPTAPTPTAPTTDAPTETPTASPTEVDDSASFGMNVMGSFLVVIGSSVALIMSVQ